MYVYNIYTYIHTHMLSYRHLYIYICTIHIYVHIMYAHTRVAMNMWMQWSGRGAFCAMVNMCIRRYGVNVCVCVCNGAGAWRGPVCQAHHTDRCPKRSEDSSQVYDAGATPGQSMSVAQTVDPKSRRKPTFVWPCTRTT